MINLNINSNISKKATASFPTAHLTCLLNMSTYESEGTTYYTNTKGNDIPVVSGTGLDIILDFSVLNDVRLDKSNSTYWGSSLNAYFYYDALNPYHFKLKDFHYKKFNAQVTFGNTCFLKANATSATNNVIESVQALAIYSVEQVDKLARIKTFIGIQPYFESENLVNNGTFDSETGWILGANWSILDGKLKAIEVAGGGTSLAYQTMNFDVGDSYRSKITMSDDAGGTFKISMGGNSPSSNMSSNGVYDQIINISSISINRLWIQAVVGGTANFDDFEIYKRFEDYYSSVATPVNIIDYGAVMDGITNDVAAITAAYEEYLATNRTTIYIPNGTALISFFSKFGLSDNFIENVKFTGESFNAKIIREIGNTQTLFHLYYMDKVEIKNLTFDGQNDSDRAVLAITRSENIVLENIHVKNSIVSPFVLYGVKNCTLSNFSITDLQDNGGGGNHGLDLDIYSSAAPVFINDNILIENGLFNNYGQDATKIENSTNVTLKDCDCYGRVYTYNDDIRLANCRGIIFDGNTFRKNAKTGVGYSVSLNFLRDDNVLIKNNTFIDQPLTGSIKLTDVFWGCSIEHDAVNDEITITDIIIGNAADDLITATHFDIIRILNVGDTFTLPDATGFSTLEFEVTELLSATSLKASITTSPSQITALTDVNVTYTRLKNPIIEIYNNTFPDKSYISDELKAVANIHDNIYLDGDSD